MFRRRQMVIEFPPNTPWYLQQVANKLGANCSPGVYPIPFEHGVIWHALFLQGPIGFIPATGAEVADVAAERVHLEQRLAA